MKTGWMKMVGVACNVGAALAVSIQAAPPGPTLPEYVAKAERIVVGKLDPWETHQMLPAKPGASGPWAFRYAVVQIQVREVLKGPADLKTVPLRLCVGWVDKPVDESVVPGVYQSGADGVWILTREEGQYVGPCFAAAKQAEIVGLLKQQPPTKTPPVEEPAVKPIRLPGRAARTSIAAETIRWGTPVNGLQLGIAPPVSKNGDTEVLFDGNALRVRVFCRNAGDAPVRLLASVHTCLLGEGGNNALLASELTLAPKDGGKTISVTYQGWNHLSLLDKRRSKGKGPQETLNDSLGGKADIQLSEEDAKRMTTVLAPGETGRETDIHFEPWKKPWSWWWLKCHTDTVTAGTYRVTATFKVDQELSEWKGEVASPALEVEIGQPAGSQPEQK